MRELPSDHGALSAVAPRHATSHVGSSDISCAQLAHGSASEPATHGSARARELAKPAARIARLTRPSPAMAADFGGSLGEVLAAASRPAIIRPPPTRAPAANGEHGATSERDDERGLRADGATAAPRADAPVLGERARPDPPDFTTLSLAEALRLSLIHI